MVTAVPLPSSDLSPQKIHQLLKQSPPEAQYKLRCSLHKDQVWSRHSVSRVALFAFHDSNSKLLHHQPAATTSTANGSAGGGDMAEVKKEATKVTRKLNEITEKLESLDTQLRLAMFGGAALLASNLLLLILFLFFG